MFTLSKVLFLLAISSGVLADTRFKTLKSAQSTKAHDLSKFGYFSDVLPGALVNNGTHFVYDSSLSEKLYRQVLAGQRNRTQYMNKDYKSAREITLGARTTVELDLEYCSSANCEPPCSSNRNSYSSNSCVNAPDTQCVFVSYARGAKFNTWNRPGCTGDSRTWFDDCNQIDAGAVEAAATVSLSVQPC